MRIFISALRLRFDQAHGNRSYFSGLLLGLERIKTRHEVFVAGDSALAAWMRSNTPSLNPVEAPVPAPSYQRMRSERRLAPRYAGETSADVSFFPFNLAPRMPTKTAVFVHDLVSVYYLKNHPFNSLIKYAAVALHLRATCRRADVVLTGTRETQRQIIDTGWIPAPKVLCVNDAVAAGSTATRRPEGLDLATDAFMVLVTGTNYPHKDRRTAVRAVHRLISEHPKLADSCRLVIVGSEDNSDIRQELRALKMAGITRDLGYVESAELEWLMQRANALLHTTWHEGFGLGILEAQMRGVPVVAADIPVSREVSGGAALFFEPGDADAAADHLDHLYHDDRLRNSLVAQGRVNAANYSIERMAKETLQVLQNIVGETGE